MRDAYSTGFTSIRHPSPSGECFGLRFVTCLLFRTKVLLICLGIVAILLAILVASQEKMLYVRWCSWATIFDTINDCDYFHYPHSSH